MTRICRYVQVWFHGDRILSTRSRDHSRHPRAVIATLICVLGLLAPIGLRAQEGGDRLSWSTNGPIPESTPQLRNPSYLVSLKQVQELLFKLRERARDSAYVEAAIAGTGASLADLLATRVLRRQGELYDLNFPLLTTNDLHMVKEVSERFARSLADLYRERRAEIEEILGRYPLKQIDQRMLAYVLLGCFSLDWDGLDITQEMGYRTPFLTEGVGSVHWATEKQPDDFFKGLYWGSHSARTDDGLALTSFGDHARPFRFAFPDLLWRLGSAFPDIMWQAVRSYDVDIPEELRPAIAGLGRKVLSELTQQVAAVMMALREGRQSAAQIAASIGSEPGQTRDVLALLVALEYVKRDGDHYAAAIPVFSEADAPMIHDLLGLSREIITAWLQEYYEPLKAELRQTTPVGHAVPFEDTFYYVWHYVFGIANRVLVDEGMFADPYGADRTYQGYVPVVWHRSLGE